MAAVVSQLQGTHELGELQVQLKRLRPAPIPVWGRQMPPLSWSAGRKLPKVLHPKCSLAAGEAKQETS